MMQAHPPAHAPRVSLGALPRFARRLEAFLLKLDDEAPVRWEQGAAAREVLQEQRAAVAGLEQRGELLLPSSAQAQAQAQAQRDEEEEEAQPESSLPIQHFTPSRGPAQRRNIGASSPGPAPIFPATRAQESRKKTDESGFAWLRIQVPRPGYADSVRARPKWAGLAALEVGEEEAQDRMLSGDELDESAVSDEAVPAPSPPLSSIQVALGGDDGAEDFEAFVTSTSLSEASKLANHNSRKEDRDTDQQFSKAALPVPSALNSSGEQSRSSRPETGQSYSITSPSDASNPPVVATEDRPLASVPLPALQGARRLDLATIAANEVPPHVDHLHLHRPFEQEADLTEASMSLERSADKEGNGADGEDVGVRTRRGRQARSKSATDMNTSKPRTTRKAAKAGELPTAAETRGRQDEPITPAPLPALAARVLDFGQMTAITTPGDVSASAALHLRQAQPGVDTPRSPTEKRSHLPAVKTGLRLLPGGAGSVGDQLRSNSESRAEPLRARARVDDDVLPGERRRRASSSGGSPPATGGGNGGGASKTVLALSQTQSDSATDEEGEQHRSTAKEAILPVSRQPTRTSKETHKTRGGSSAAPLSRKGAHDAALLEALDREKGAALKRKADVANERLDRLQGQEKRIRGASRTLGRSRSTAQERAKGATGATAGQGRLEMSNVPPEGAHKALPLAAEASVQPPPAVRPSSSAPAANAAPPSSAVSASASKKHKSVPQRKPAWTSLEACVASWDQWIAEGRLPHAHPLQGPTGAPTPSLSTIHGHPAPGGTPDGPHLLFAGMTFLVVHARYHAALAGTIERLVRRGGRVRVARAGMLQEWAAAMRGRQGEGGGGGGGGKDLGSVTHLVSLGLPRSPSSEECARLLGLALPAPAAPSGAGAGSMSASASLQAQVNALLGRDASNRAGAGGKSAPLRFVTGEWLAECQRRGRLVDEREPVSWRLA